MDVDIAAVPIILALRMRSLLMSRIGATVRKSNGPSFGHPHVYEPRTDPEETAHPLLAGTLPNRAFNPSAIVGWVRMASRSAV